MGNTDQPQTHTVCLSIHSADHMRRRSNTLEYCYIVYCVLYAGGWVEFFSNLISGSRRRVYQFIHDQRTPNIQKREKKKSFRLDDNNSIRYRDGTLLKILLTFRRFKPVVFVLAFLVSYNLLFFAGFDFRKI